MRAVVRATLANQPTLELPYRRVSQPSESVILDALHDLDMRYQSDGMPAWYPWVAVARYQRGSLSTLDVRIERGFVWDPSG